MSTATIIRVKKDNCYTVVSNGFLRDDRLSLKAVGLLVRILSLPPDWDFSMAGLASICKESTRSIRSTMAELEAAGYVEREKVRGTGGTYSWQYTVHEQSTKPQLRPCGGLPHMVDSTVDDNSSFDTKPQLRPCGGKPHMVNVTQLSKEELSKDNKERARKKSNEVVHAYGVDKNVHLTDRDCELLEKRGINWREYAERLSEYKSSTGRKYKNDRATIMTWYRRDQEKATTITDKSKEICDVADAITEEWSF